KPDSRLGQTELAMAVKRTRRTRDIERLLREKFPGYPKDYPPDVYEYNPSSIRVRLVHDMFKGMDRSDREKVVTPVIRTLPEDTQSDLMVLLLLPPDELSESLM